MKVYDDFIGACADLLRNGYDRSDNEQTAHIQDLYAKMKPSEVVELFKDTANYTALAWVMGGQEVARVAAQIERDHAAAQFTERLTAMGNAHKEQIDQLTEERDSERRLYESTQSELDREREDHARTIKAKQAAEQLADERREDHTAAEVEHLRQQVRDNETIVRALLDHIHTASR